MSGAEQEKAPLSAEHARLAEGAAAAVWGDWKLIGPYVADRAGSVGRDPVGLAARILWARSKCRARPHPHTHVRAARSDRDSRRGSGAVLPDAQKRPPMVLAGLSVAGVAIGTSAMLKSSLLRSSSTRNASS